MTEKKTITIASWNVNSAKARANHIERFLKKKEPDILFLQELKGETLPDLSSDYDVFFIGQKAYNGVATLIRKNENAHAAEISNKLGGDDQDTQARYLETEAFGLRLLNIYLPNGNPVDSDKFPYKLIWMNRLYERLQILLEQKIPFLVGGDFNVIPADSDCYDPDAWRSDALFHEQTLAKWRALLNLGLYDAFRVQHPHEADAYTFWDYQAGAWPKNRGIRIDHFLLSPALADRLTSCHIDKEPRSWDQPSDHTPILIGLSAYSRFI